MKNNLKRIVVTGLGVVSSIGIGREAFWNSLIKGTSGISEITSFDTSTHITHRGGEVRNFKPEEYINKRLVPFISRGTQLALAATRLAISDAGVKAKTLSDETTSFCLGTTLGELPTLEKINRQWLKEGVNV